MTWIRRAGREGIVAATTMLALACGNGDDDGPTGTTGSIQVAVDPATLSVQQGSTGSVTATLTRGGGFSGAVTLASTGLPSGVTFTITPAQLSGTTARATVDITVAATVAPGVSIATITATAQGVVQATTTYQLTVTSPPAGSNRIEYQFCDASTAPVFLAYQDGIGAWQPAAGSTSGGTTGFVFHLTQGRGGVLAVFRTASSVVADALRVGRVATLRQSVTRALSLRDRPHPRLGIRATGHRSLHRASLADVYDTRIVYASTSELTQDGADSCEQTPPVKTVTGTVTGLGDGQFGIVALGGWDDLFVGGVSTNPVTFIVAGGPVDFVGTRMAIEGTPPDKVVVFRNLDVPDGGSLPQTIDFNGPASSVPATAMATVTGAAGDDIEIYVDLVTVNSHQVMWYDLAPSPTTTRPWAGLGSAVMVSGDLHGLYAIATPPSNATGDFRAVLKYLGAVADQTVALGATINAPATSQVAAGAYPRYRFQGAFPAEYDKAASIDVRSDGGSANAISITATNAWLTGSGNPLAYDFTMPDVSGLAGFPLAARLTAGPNVALASAFGFPGPGIFDQQPVAGTVFKSATRSVSIIVP